MKKNIILLVTALAAFAVLGCSNIASTDVTTDAAAKAFEMPDMYYIGGNNIVYNLDRSTGAFHGPVVIDDNVTVIEGSYYSSWTGWDATFYINTAGEIFQRTWDGWVQRWGCWNAIDVGSYKIDSTYAINSNGQIHKFTTSWNGFEWFEQIPGKTAEKVEVDANGNPWVITTDAKLYKYENSVWTEVPCTRENNTDLIPMDLGLGNGTVYIIGAIPGFGHPAIYGMDENGNFEYILGNFIHQMDVDRDGIIFYTDIEHGWVHSYLPGVSTEPIRHDYTVRFPAIDLGA